ncbi:hypothetical protein V1477_003132 [Vespula maculifrons]|uniref:Uncharacterized protein n=1 Tax=Vespula maculifrons TaxID=7453 RepID=A0ABD2CUQ2_VESMC
MMIARTLVPARKAGAICSEPRPEEHLQCLRPDYYYLVRHASSSNNNNTRASRVVGCDDGSGGSGDGSGSNGDTSSILARVYSRRTLIWLYFRSRCYGAGYGYNGADTASRTCVRDVTEPATSSSSSPSPSPSPPSSSSSSSEAVAAAASSTTVVAKSHYDNYEVLLPVTIDMTVYARACLTIIEIFQL